MRSHRLGVTSAVLTAQGTGACELQCAGRHCHTWGPRPTVSLPSDSQNPERAPSSPPPWRAEKEGSIGGKAISVHPDTGPRPGLVEQVHPGEGEGSGKGPSSVCGRRDTLPLPIVQSSVRPAPAVQQPSSLSETGRKALASIQRR